MSPRTKLRLLWLTALVSPLVACYAFASFIYYAWRSAFVGANLDRLSIWAGYALAVFLVFLGASVVVVARLLRHYNNLPRLPDEDTTP